MFSSNQVLEVSGSLSKFEGAMESTLRFVFQNYDCFVKLTEDGEIKTNGTIIYQITSNNKYCLGITYGDSIPDGWLKYPKNWNIETICADIREYLEPLPCDGEWGNGLVLSGFIMKAFQECRKPEKDGVKWPKYGIVYFEPFACYYSK